MVLCNMGFGIITKDTTFELYKMQAFKKMEFLQLFLPYFALFALRSVKFSKKRKQSPPALTDGDSWEIKGIWESYQK